MTILSMLPPEITLQILDYLPVSAIANLERCSRDWNEFINDQTSRIWSQHVPSTAPWPLQDSDRAQLAHGWQLEAQERRCKTLDSTLYDVNTWKSLCKSRTLLLRNWRGRLETEGPRQVLADRPSPANRMSQSARRSSASLSAGLPFWQTDVRTRRIREGLAWSAMSETTTATDSDSHSNRLNVDADGLPIRYKLPYIKQSIYTFEDSHRMIWRFKPDFKRRIMLTTSQNGGLLVFDMDDQTYVWGHPGVIPYAHLEYDNGWAVWNDDGDNLQVWRWSEEGGVFEAVHLLPHSNEIRGFHFVFPNLCVVSTDGRGFVYDVTRFEDDTLLAEFPIEKDARGHLYQYKDVVTYCYEKKGYHFHQKLDGMHLGVLDPKVMGADLPMSRTYCIKHDLPRVSGVPQHFITQGPHDTYAQRIIEALNDSLHSRSHPEVTLLRKGSLASASWTAPRSLEEEKWGAPCLWHDWMVCISMGGRMMLCSDWRGALQSAERARECTTMIECHKTGDDARFDFGGWLSVLHGRVIWEIDDWVSSQIGRQFTLVKLIHVLGTYWNHQSKFTDNLLSGLRPTSPSRANG